MIVEVKDDVKHNTHTVISNSTIRIATNDVVFNIQQTPDGGGIRIYVADGKSLIASWASDSIVLKVEK